MSSSTGKGARHHLRRLPGLLVASAVGAIGAIVPVVAAGPPRPAVTRDVDYVPPRAADGRGHLLDLYLPGGTEGPRPLLIWTGGSGWLGDDGKDSAGPIAEYFTARGYAVAGVSVRSSAQTRFPGQLHDVKAAIRWLRAESGRLGLDPGRFAIMGDSSGGWTAAMAGLTGEVPTLEGDLGVTTGSSRVQAVVDLFGPVDFATMNGQMLPWACEPFNQAYGLDDCHDDPRAPEALLLGGAVPDSPELVRAANPVTYVSADSPPFWIAHGQQDTTVPHGQSVQLVEALRAAGRPVTFFSVPGAGHDVDQVLDPRRGGGPTLDTVREFLDRALRTGRGGADRTGQSSSSSASDATASTDNVR